MVNEKYKQFWLTKSKEEIINAYGESIHNGEILLKRIEEGVKFIDRYLSLDLDEFNASSLLKKLREILTRGDEYPKEE